MKKVLLIIDVQNAIVAGTATPERQPVIDAALEAVVGRLAKLQEQARKAGVPVVMVQHDGGAGDPLARGTEGWKIRAELAPRSGEPVVEKRSGDSFFDTDLEERLRERSATHVVIGGCQTQFCVDTTVRRAVSLGYDVTLVGDGHTTSDRAGLTFEQIVAHHNATLDGFDAGTHLVWVKPSADITF
jgi:nicotinamidase-related amidase